MDKGKVGEVLPAWTKSRRSGVGGVKVAVFLFLRLFSLSVKAL